MDGWNICFLLGWPMFRGELLVSGRVVVSFSKFESLSLFCKLCILHQLPSQRYPDQNSPKNLRMKPRRSVYFTIRLGLGEWQWDHLYGHAQGLVDHPGGPCEILLRGRRYWANTHEKNKRWQRVFGGIWWLVWLVSFVNRRQVVWWTSSGEMIHLVKLLVRRVMTTKQHPEGCFVFSVFHGSRLINCK